MLRQTFMQSFIQYMDLQNVLVDITKLPTLIMKNNLKKKLSI